MELRARQRELNQLQRRDGFISYRAVLARVSSTQLIEGDLRRGKRIKLLVEAVVEEIAEEE